MWQVEPGLENSAQVPAMKKIVGGMQLGATTTIQLCLLHPASTSCTRYRQHRSNQTAMANDAFFQKKRKRTSSGGVDAAEKRNRVSAKRRTRDQPDEDDNADLAGEEGPVGADMDLRHNYDSGSEDEDETAAQARVRLAKAYLEGIKADEDRAQGTLFCSHIQ